MTLADIKLRTNDPQKVALLLMMLLTFVTGIVDAVGYLGLDRVFAGNMTGNVVVLGMAMAGAGGLPVIGPAIALGTFTIGALGSGLLLRHRRKAWGGAVTTLLATGAGILALVSAAMAVPAWHGNHTLDIIASSCIAAAMGAQAAVARSVGVADMTTVVVTSTLTSWASESIAEAGLKGAWNRRLASVATICAGALTGALMLPIGPTLPLIFASALTATVCLIGHRLLYIPHQRTLAG